MTTDEPYCKQVSNTAFIKTRGTNKIYEEAIEASARFNKRLVKERKTRLPFLDSQTTVAQGNCMIWNKEYQRVKSFSTGTGIVMNYQVKKWIKNRRLTFENGDFGMLHRMPIHNKIDLVQHSNEMELLSGYIMNSQHIAYTKPQPIQQQQHMFVKQVSAHSGEEHPHSHDQHHKKSADHHHPHHNHHHHNNQNHNLQHTSDWYMDDDDNSKHDNENESEDEEDSKRKKSSGKRSNGRCRKKELPIEELERIFTCDQCGAKYKTRPGLSYHVQKAHNLRLAVNPTGLAPYSTIPMNKITREPIEPSGDDNTNSIFESVYDENSSSMPQHSQSASTSTPLNHNTNSNQAKSTVGAAGAVKCQVCFCVEHEPRGQANTNEKFVTCSECAKQFHQVSCLGFGPKIMEAVKHYKWLCIECKRCTVCGNSENDDKLLFCDDCDRGYHMYCLNPPLTEAPAGDWRCDLCVKVSTEMAGK